MTHIELGNPQLVDEIVARMSETSNQLLSFHDYMALCLYHSQYGYYSNSIPKIGKDGDFYTVSSIGSLMGEMLAKTFVHYWRECGIPEHLSCWIVEWGGGTGRLASQILDELQQCYPERYEHIRYTIVDRSGYHQWLQKNSLQPHRERIRVVSPEQWDNVGQEQGLPPCSIILSNELLDAFPIHRYSYQTGNWYELFVGWDEDEQRFVEHRLRVEDQSVSEFVPQQIKLADGQVIEYNRHVADWIKQVTSVMQSGMLVTIDYGELAEVLYAPARMEGTLMCYYRHQANTNPYQRVGEQDITSHVNFSSCIEVGQSVGLTRWTYETQQQFLLRSGILERLQSHHESDPFHPIAKRNRAIRQLITQDSMGQVF
ncbi:SAM-dependent methyltransferase, partial [Aeromicrobium sp. PE09-221]|uniref:class I SAM-dependent methyltransferase n=1 Tax=Aeromicrobium sp. PE09-221 TaxID=1898043 RepID=UPI0011245237